MNENQHNEIKRKVFSQSQKSDFEQEAADGWKEIGEDRWDSVMQNLSEKIDQTLEKQNEVRVESPIVPIEKNRWRTFSVAAAVLVLVALGVSLTLMWTQKETGEDLFLAYYKPLESPEDTYRGDEGREDAESLSRQASDAYEDLDYKRAIAFYSELHKEFPESSKYVLFLGLSYINDGNFDDAIVLFNSHQVAGESYDEDIEWYLALAHLKKGEIQTSKILLSGIAEDSENYYSQTATELVQRISKIK